MQENPQNSQGQGQGFGKMPLREHHEEEKLMFGRVIVNKGELKVREFDDYRSYYCGLCRSLKKKGLFTAFSLNYDMTFLALLLNSLYECDTKKEKRSCICHGCKKHYECTDFYSDYVADMNILLAYYKCLDDFHDEKNIIKFVYALYLKPKVKEFRRKYQKKCDKIEKCLTTLSEKENSAALEECANIFGELLGEVFTPNDDLWYHTLRSMGFYLGKFIYIADACEDYEEDMKKKRPNPLFKLQSDNYKEECEVLMNMMAAECAVEFEKLPLIENVEILRNIIYAGIWQKKGYKNE